MHIAPVDKWPVGRGACRLGLVGRRHAADGSGTTVARLGPDRPIMVTREETA